MKRTLPPSHGVLAIVCKYAAAIGDAPIVATGLLKAPKDLPKPVNSLTESGALEVVAQLRKRLPEPLRLCALSAGNSWPRTSSALAPPGSKQTAGQESCLALSGFGAGQVTRLVDLLVQY